MLARLIENSALQNYSFWRSVKLSVNSNSGNMPRVHLLDYAAGNIRSLVNAIEKLGWEVEWVKEPSDVAKAEVSSNRDTFTLCIYADG